MAKSRTAARPVIAPGRIPQPVYAAIKQEAARSGRSLAEELAQLAHSAIEVRKRFPDSTAAISWEMTTLAFVIGGGRKAQERGIDEPWSTDLECRREAVLSACATLITQFFSGDPDQQADFILALKGRLWSRPIQINPETEDRR